MTLADSERRPAISGCVGGVLGGLLSDGMLRRGHSLTLARKLPKVLGLLLSSAVVLCIYVDSGSRNILGVTTTVQCVVGVLDHVLERVRKEVQPKYPNVDDVVALSHSYGCGVAINAPNACACTTIWYCSTRRR